MLLYPSFNIFPTLIDTQFTSGTANAIFNVKIVQSHFLDLLTIDDSQHLVPDWTLDTCRVCICQTHSLDSK
jgi:hypothetical protein